METPPPVPVPVWLPFLIIGAFAIVFPAFWCAVAYLLSHLSGWQRLAKYYSAPEPPAPGGGTSHGGVRGKIGGVSYKGVLELQFVPEGFYLETIILFRVGHPRLFIPWSHDTSRRRRHLLWCKLDALTIGDPPLATIALPASLIESHAPPTLPLSA
ncbi:MAG: hypothetical protein KDL87_14960 [Verrucomicrobiae bacterium]|nr:hypothetical protein [Verrucomicrobiae bacterium]